MRETCLIIFILFACCLAKSILADKCVPLEICCFHWFCCVSCHSVFLLLCLFSLAVLWESNFLWPFASAFTGPSGLAWLLIFAPIFSFSKSMSPIKSPSALPHTASSCLHTSLFGDSSIRRKVSLWCKQLINNLRQQTWLVLIYIAPKKCCDY